MKLTKEELIASISEAPIDDEIKMTMLENVTDSIEGEKVDLTNYVEKSTYDELKAKYIQRFTEGAPVEQEKQESEVEINEEEVTYESLFEEV